MRFVAIARAPASADEAAKGIAGVLGLTLAEARMRMAPEPPTLVARTAVDKAAALVRALRQVGVAALSVDTQVPSEKERVIARSFALTDAGATFTPRFGPQVEVAWPDVLVVLRGQRAARSEVERSEKSRNFSITTAVASGGLKITHTSTKTTRASEESTEQVILVYARCGRTVLLAERQVDFSCLGPGMQPSSTANMVELARRLREGAKAAFYDERLLRLGRRPLPFVAGGESRVATSSMTATKSDTSGALDVLAEIMRQAVGEGLLQ